jgi:hypothetical protein
VIARCGTPSGGSDLVDVGYDAAAYVPRAGRSVATMEPHGTNGSLSPDGAEVAFVREDHAIWLHRFGTRRARCLLAARRGGDPRWWGSYAVAPLWSPDGRLLWFSSTSAKRTRVPDAGLLAKLEKMFPDDRTSLERNIEFAHWDFRHRVGIVDVETKSVWMEEGHWHDVAWAPLNRRSRSSGRPSLFRRRSGSRSR